MPRELVVIAILAVIAIACAAFGIAELRTLNRYHGEE